MTRVIICILRGLRVAGLIPPPFRGVRGDTWLTLREATREMTIRLSLSLSIDRILRIRGRLAILPPRSSDPLNAAVSPLLVDAADRRVHRDFGLASRGVDRRSDSIVIIMRFRNPGS